MLDRSPVTILKSFDFVKFENSQKNNFMHLILEVDFFKFIKLIFLIIKTIISTLKNKNDLVENRKN